MKKHDVPEGLLASLLADYKKPEYLIGENGLLKRNNSPSGRQARHCGQTLRDWPTSGSAEERAYQLQSQAVGI